MIEISDTASQEKKMRRRIKAYILFFIFATVISGITAFPIETELKWFLDHPHFIPSFLRGWISEVHYALSTTNANFPFLAYGTDWLAWAHLIIALLFLGPLKDPVRNVWVIQWGIISCFLVFPLAFIAGYLRGVPLYWQLIDCSFGALGLIPLFLCLKDIRHLERLMKKPI